MIPNDTQLLVFGIRFVGFFFCDYFCFYLGNGKKYKKDKSKRYKNKRYNLNKNKRNEKKGKDITGTACRSHLYR